MSNTSLTISRRTWLLIAAAWLAWALLSAVEQAARNGWLHRPFGFGDALVAKIPIAATLAGATPVILMLSRQAPVFGTAGRRRWVPHVAACVLLVVLIDAVACALTSWLTGTPFDLGAPRPYAMRVVGLWLVPVSLLYWLIVVIDHGVRHFVHAREQAELAARLSAQVADARLEALRLQLQPHFLFNALHSIGTLVRTGHDAEAIRVTAGLGTLLRRVLDDAPLEVPLRDELAFIEEYLAIEQIRFSDRLTVCFDVAADVNEVLVPHLLLQPLVENALRHGLQPRIEGGSLTISARRDADALVLTVADDGVGLPNAEELAARVRVGLTNTRARLAALYGARQSLEMRQLNGSGTVVTIALPFGREPAMPIAAAV